MKTPLGVALIACLHFLVSFATLGGLAFIAGASFFAQATGISSMLFIALGISILLIGLFNFLVGLGLLRHKHWARTAAITLAFIWTTLGILGTFSNVLKGRGITHAFLSNIIGITLSTTIWSYLWLNKRIKKAFSQ